MDAQRRIAAAVRARRVGLNLTQVELAQRAGLSLGSLKRFEQSGAIALSSLLQIAHVLDSLDGFDDLFAPPEPRSLHEVMGAAPHASHHGRPVLRRVRK